MADIIQQASEAVAAGTDKMAAEEWGGIAKPGNSDLIGGPRTPSELQGYAERDAKAPWKCPACGQENSEKRLSEGCGFCGSGANSAKHVGVDKRVEPKKPKFEIQNPLHYAPVSQDADQAFLDWMQRGGGNLIEAFRAGYDAGRGDRMTHPVIARSEDHVDESSVVGGAGVGGRLPDPADFGRSPADVGPVAGAGAVEGEPGDVPESAGRTGESFPGDPRSRTLLAALNFLREQVYTQEPEEAQTGEWLSVADLEDWISKLKQELNGPYS